MSSEGNGSGTRPKVVQSDQIDQEDLEYQMAVLTVAKDTDSNGVRA